MQLNYPKGSDYNTKTGIAKNTADYMRQRISGVAIMGVV